MISLLNNLRANMNNQMNPGDLTGLQASCFLIALHGGHTEQVEFSGMAIFK